MKENTSSNHSKKIQCSVGILTYNSEKTLRRALDSVKDFSDIIISDGGSTDGTLEIAHEYGCVVIEQDAKLNPSRDLSHPIGDFSRERNKMIGIAKNDWFFWLDSDEYISKELHDEITTICSEETPTCFAYEIPIVHQSPDASVTYQVWEQAYQIRFFNLKTEGRFQRKIHEKFIFNTDTYRIGRLSGAWYVPTSKTAFFEYKKAVNYRLGLMLADTAPKTLRMYAKKALYLPLKRSVGILYRFCMLRLRYSAKEVMPLGYVRNRLYSQWVTFRIVTQLYFGRGNNHE